jgi:hypothetical protein
MADIGSGKSPLLAAGGESNFDVGDNLVLVEADIDIEGFDETTEDDPGGLVVRRAADNVAPRKKIIIQKIPNWDGDVLFTKVSGDVKVFDAAAGGTEITFNGTDNKYANANLPKTLYVQGNGASSSMRDTVLKADPIIVRANERGVADTVSFTVLWVSVTVAFTGDVSNDNDKANWYAGIATSGNPTLGLQTFDNGADKWWGRGFEARGLVYPAQFAYPDSDLHLDRDVETRYYNGSDPLVGTPDRKFSATIPAGNDKSGIFWRDDDPLDSDPVGAIYDLDAPGLIMVTAPKDEIRRQRFNFKEFAAITIDGSPIRASNIYEGFVRLSIKQTTAPTGDTWVIMNDIAGDNDAGSGKTKLTWNLA